MLQYMYEIGYGLIINAILCKLDKIYIGIRHVDLVWQTVQIHM